MNVSSNIRWRKQICWSPAMANTVSNQPINYSHSWSLSIRLGKTSFPSGLRVPFLIPRRPTTSLHALPARRERCLLIRSMNTAWLQGHDRRPSQQLGSLQTVQAHRETPARKRRSVLIYSLGISKDFSWSFSPFRQQGAWHKQRQRRRARCRSVGVDWKLRSPHPFTVDLKDFSLDHREYFN